MRDRKHDKQEVLRRMWQRAVQSAARQMRLHRAFCEDCGTALAGHAAPAATSSPQATSTAPQIRVTPKQPAGDPLEGERKTVTALFANIEGSMDLIEDLDPEEARAGSLRCSVRRSPMRITR